MNAAVPIGTTQEDFYIYASELAKLLKCTDAEIALLARSGVIPRIADPISPASYRHS